ncbi:predicted protein [Histoplasma mississippiense (nom. inval.)]|uniref:predicted protein n=1 Tax=Ajellomyces capsulatus (strain NAm1 / WU24) TaxID=2059318 RepID=UPI000157C657|nr:predicted protein [Histoplasma mississippiense (nom. inval.)]EDN08334.1 predicted protein [Histoplasma mississippiense (nom. inval.)]
MHLRRPVGGKDCEGGGWWGVVPGRFNGWLRKNSKWKNRTPVLNTSDKCIQEPEIEIRIIISRRDSAPNVEDGRYSMLTKRIDQPSPLFKRHSLWAV